MSRNVPEEEKKELERGTVGKGFFRFDERHESAGLGITMNTKPDKYMETTP